MSLYSRLIHSLAIVTPVLTGSFDDYGQPIDGTPVTKLVHGLIQPKRASEVAAFSQAGVPFSDYTIHLPIDIEPELSQAAFIRDQPDHGRRFEITGIHSFEFGSFPHLEVDAKLVGDPEGPEALGS